MLSRDEIALLCGGYRFLAVNTQVKSENRGFNTISRYPRADYIVVSENEIRLEARSRRRDLRDIVLADSARLVCGRLLITRGGWRGIVVAEHARVGILPRRLPRAAWPRGDRSCGHSVDPGRRGGAGGQDDGGGGGWGPDRVRDREWRQLRNRESSAQRSRQGRGAADDDVPRRAAADGAGQRRGVRLGVRAAAPAVGGARRSADRDQQRRQVREHSP